VSRIYIIGEQSMDVIIREAQIRDIPDIFRMNNEINDIDCATAESMKKSLETNENELVFVAIHNDKAIGFICGQLYSSICYTSAQSEITELFVSEEYRRKGIASMLIKNMELEFIKNNAHEIIVITGINNVTAQQLYEKCGYEIKRRAYKKST
jgi:ribosomal protein S18 acetylase RimI-like enzyme